MQLRPRKKTKVDPDFAESVENFSESATRTMQLRQRKKTKVDPDFAESVKNFSESESEPVYQPKVRKPRSRKTSPSPQSLTQPVIQQMSQFPLLSLPDELLVQIISMVTDPKTMIAFMTSCKGIRRVMDPINVTGQRIWSRLRSNLGWPDPNSIRLSDYAFLKCYYGRGCNNCDDRPLTRKPYWIFGGLRICSTCMNVITVRDYDLESQKVNSALYKYLPSLSISGYSKYRSYWTYHAYLRSQILTSPPTPEQITEMQAFKEKLRQFTIEFENNELRVQEKRKEDIEDSKVARTVAIDAFLKDKIPLLDPQLYGLFQCYNSACSSSTNFSDRSKSIFWKKFEAELTDRKIQISREQFQTLAARLCREVGGFDSYRLIQDQSFLELERTVTELMDIDAVQNMCTGVILDIKDCIRQPQIKRERQAEWLRKYGGSHQVNRELASSALYVEADAENEVQFKELAENLKEDERRQKIKIEIRKEWLAKYGGSYELDERLRMSDLYKEADPEKEMQFKEFAESLTEIVRPLVAKRNRQWEWLTKYGGSHEFNEGLRMSDLYKEADPEKEMQFKEFAESLTENIRQQDLIKRRQSAWLKKYGGSHKVNKVLRMSYLYRKADPEKEMQLKEFADSLKEDERQEKIRKEIRKEWLAKYGGSYEIHERLRMSDLFNEADPEKEMQFKEFVDSLKEKCHVLEEEYFNEVKKSLLKIYTEDLVDRHRKYCCNCGWCSSQGATLQRLREEHDCPISEYRILGVNPNRL